MSIRASGPQTIGGVLDTGFRMFRVGVMAIAPIVYLGSLANGLWSWQINDAVMERVAAGGDPMAAFLAPGTIVAFILMVVITTWFFTAALNRTRDIARDQDGSFGSAIVLGIKRLPFVLVASILYTLATLVGLVALLVPGIYLSVALGFCFYSAAVDGKGPIAALGYSYDIVKGNWWRTTAVFTVIVILAFVLYLVIGFVAALFFMSGGNVETLSSSQFMIDVVITPILSAILGALFYCLGFALYDDLRLRNEGGDLAERIEGLGEA